MELWLSYWYWFFSHMLGVRLYGLGRVGLVMKTSCQWYVKCGNSHMPFLWFLLMLSMTDVWEAWQCPSHTLETEMRRYSAKSRGTKQECSRRPHPAIHTQWVVRRRWTKEVTSCSFWEKSLLKLKSSVTETAQFPLVCGLRLGWCPPSIKIQTCPRKRCRTGMLWKRCSAHPP